MAGRSAVQALELSPARRRQFCVSSICEAQSRISVSFVQQHAINRAIPLAPRNFAA